MKLKLLNKSNKGFTLIELLVVIGILAVLLAITLIAINPARQFAQANDTQRRSDVTAILNAINQYMASNGGALPSGVINNITDRPISSAVGGTGADFCNALVPTYIAALPKDPKTGSYADCATYTTGYTVSVTNPAAGETARITITAPETELAATDILVTR